MNDRINRIHNGEHGEKVVIPKVLANEEENKDDDEIGQNCREGRDDGRVHLVNSIKVFTSNHLGEKSFKRLSGHFGDVCLKVLNMENEKKMEFSAQTFFIFQSSQLPQRTR